MKKELHEIQWLNCKVESESFVKNESGKKVRQYIISGPFTKVDVPNRNNRVYKRDEMNKAIAALRPMVQEGRIRMLVDHPDWMSAGGSLIKAGALLTEISDVQEDGFAYYKAKILNTVVGKDLKAILDGGSKVGVSTRGYGLSKEEEIPGYSGKFEVIYDYEISSIDFVDDPSVIDTEAYMHIESKKRRNGMFKTVEELKSACPELAKQLVESATDVVRKELEAKIEEAEKKVETAHSELSGKTKEVETLVESIKAIFPDKFTVVEESTLVSEKETEIKELSAKLDEAVENTKALTKQIKDIEDAHVKSERDSYIEHLQSTDKDFFEIESFKDCFENCFTKDEVKTVYEANSKVIQEMKSKINQPAPSKTVQTEEVAEEKTGLNEAQKKDMEARNLQRSRQGLVAMDEANYLEKFGHLKL